MFSNRPHCTAKRRTLIAYLGGYPRHLDFRIGARTEENREWFSRYVKASMKIPDGAEGVDWLSTNEENIAEAGDFWAFQQLCRAARDNKIVSGPSDKPLSLCATLTRALCTLSELTRPPFAGPFGRNHRAFAGRRHSVVYKRSILRSGCPTK